MSGKDLPDAELEVLSCLYRLGEATAREIREEMEGFRPMAHGSVVTLLKRLEEKSLVTTTDEKVGKAFIYKPTKPPRTTYRAVMRNLVNRVFGGNSVALVASLIDSKPLSDDEINDLQELLETLKKNKEK